MLVRDLQQVLGNFTDKFNKGMGKVEGKGNAIMYAKVYVDLGNGRLSEIQKIEAHENTLIGATAYLVPLICWSIIIIGTFSQ
jgi:hypothetical protein